MSDINIENQNKKQKLGRGLGSLLSQSSVSIKEEVIPKEKVAEINPESRVWSIAIDKIETSEYQPRTHFDKKALEELAVSIKEKGIVQPIIVRKNQQNKFEIIAGERRWRAAQIAGLHEVPAIIKTLSNKDTLEIAIIENIQREDLNPIEEAEAYQKLMNEFTLTQQQISEKVGKERATVANCLRLLTLPKSVVEMIKNKEISSGHAKVLMSLENPEQIILLAKKAINSSLSVRKLENEVNKFKNNKTTNENRKISAKDHSVLKIGDDLQKALGTKVQIDYNEGKGKISIQFYSNDELTEISERIISGCMK